MATVELPVEKKVVPRSGDAVQRFVFGDVDWAAYQALSKAFGERHVRLAYDGERLEIMTVSWLHDRLRWLLGRLLAPLTEELGLPLRSCGSPTMDREDVDRALEPDACFYVENEPLIRDRDQIDLASDPPP